jgi:hypothetical protein
VGALANLGYDVSDQTVGNVLQRHGIPPAPERKRTTTWAEFIRAHLAVLAGTDFFTVEVLTLWGLVTYYVLFFIHLESRKVDIAGITVHPNEEWMKQMARNATMVGWGTRPAFGLPRPGLAEANTTMAASRAATPTGQPCSDTWTMCGPARYELTPAQFQVAPSHQDHRADVRPVHPWH